MDNTEITCLHCKNKQCINNCIRVIKYDPDEIIEAQTVEDEILDLENQVSYMNM